MKRHKIRILTEKEQRKLWPEKKVFLMDEICDVCGAIRWYPFIKGDNGHWEKDGERKPYCDGKDIK